MNKIKTFLHILKQSVTNIDYYNTAAKAKFSFLFKYLFLFSIIIGIVYNVMFATFYFQVSKNWPAFYNDLKAGLYQIYPADLELTVTDGTLSTNKPNPIFIKVPEKFKEMLYKVDSKLKTDSEFQSIVNDYNLAVIDTDAKVEDISKYKTFLLFTKNSFANVSKGSSENDIRYEFHAYTKDNKITKMNSATATSLLNEVIVGAEKSLFPVIVTIATVLLFSLWIILSLFIVSINLFCHLFTSIWGLILAKVIKVKYNYSEVYKMGMPIIPLFALLSLLNMFIQIPTLFLIQVALYTTVIIFALNIQKGKTTIVKDTQIAK